MERTGRIITLLILFLVVSQAIQAQQKKLPEGPRNTVQLNLLGPFTSLVNIVYTRSINSKINLYTEAGHTYMRPPIVSQSTRNLVHQEVTGYFIKAGPEILMHSGDQNKHSVAILPFYGRGEFNQDILIEHFLGEYNQRLNYTYEVSGVAAAVNFVLINLGKHWFIEGATEFNISIVNTDADWELLEYPGVGRFMSLTNANLGLGLRFQARIGFRF